MFCTQCRTQMPDNAKFCPNCGYGVLTDDRAQIKMSSDRTSIINIPPNDCEEMQKSDEQVRSEFPAPLQNANSQQITKSLRNMPGAEEVIQNERANDFSRLLPYLMIPLSIVYVISPIDLFPGPVDDIIVILVNNYLFKRTGIKFNFMKKK